MDAVAHTEKHAQSQSEFRRLQYATQELAERIARAMPTDGSVEALPRLHLNRVSQPNEPLHSLYTPVFCVIAQGSKEIFIGNERYEYNPSHYLIVTTKLPVITHVYEASQERPYLSLRLDLDPAMVSSVMIESGQIPPKNGGSVRAINASALNADLLDAVLRLVRIVESPDDAPVLTPLVEREIVYRLLMGEQASRLRYMTALGGSTHRIVMAIERLRQDYSQPLRIEDLAEDLGMSVSSFHQHFKSVTAMSPLQFQKQLRLQEARRIMLGEQLDAASAGFRVGYDDASHFSREYKRQFGLPPMRDIEQLREAAG